ncbi:MAG: ABC transporter permease [Planctomycetaceae bacterium]|nr:ABC transporter permease [Planctomycetaceae bacterium]
MRLLLLNLRRKPLRTVLTTLGVAVALLLFCFLEAVVTSFNAGVNMSDASRLVVQHKESLAFQQPKSYGPLIAQTDGVTGVVGVSWFGGLSQEPDAHGEKREEFFAQFATDLEKYLQLYPEVQLPADQRAELLSDRMGCMLGAKIADRLGKKIGDRLVLHSTIWTQTNGSSVWEFNVRALYTTDSPTFDQTMMFFHFARFDEARRFARGTTSLYFVGVSDPSRNMEVATAIDARFANSPFETRTMTEKAFNLQIVGMLGNFQLLLRSIGSAIVLTMLLVAANTMMMSARERTREMGILKAIGFTDGHVFLLLIGEAMALSLLGAVVGVGLAWLLANVLHINPIPDFFTVFFLPLESILAAFGLAALTGLISGIVPAVTGMRLKATEALRSV